MTELIKTAVESPDGLRKGDQIIVKQDHTVEYDGFIVGRIAVKESLGDAYDNFVEANHEDFEIMANLFAEETDDVPCHVEDTHISIDKPEENVAPGSYFVILHGVFISLDDPGLDYVTPYGTACASVEMIPEDSVVDLVSIRNDNGSVQRRSAEYVDYWRLKSTESIRTKDLNPEEVCF